VAGDVRTARGHVLMEIIWSNAPRSVRVGASVAPARLVDSEPFVPQADLEGLVGLRVITPIAESAV